jgi:hypothetical protein
MGHASLQYTAFIHSGENLFANPFERKELPHIGGEVTAWMCKTETIRLR